MKEIRLKISDLYEIEPQTRDQARELAAITAYVLKHYAFLHRTHLINRKWARQPLAGDWQGATKEHSQSAL
jgi:hypothetical protein